MAGPADGVFQGSVDKGAAVEGPGLRAVCGQRIMLFAGSFGCTASTSAYLEDGQQTGPGNRVKLQSAKTAKRMRGS